MIVGRANALTALGLLVLLLVVVLTAPRWTKLLTRTVPGEEAGEEGTAAAAAAAGEAEGSGGAQQKITVKLFFLAPDQPALLIEDRDVAYSADLARQIRSVVEEIVKGPQKGLAGTLPAETRVIDSFVTQDGIAYVDLSKEAAVKHAGGIARRAAERVLGRELDRGEFSGRANACRSSSRIARSPTLAGHVDLTASVDAGHDLPGRLAPPRAPPRGRHPGRPMSVHASAKAARFTESVIREMTRLANLHGAVNLAQGFPDFPAPEEVKDAACRRHRRRHQPVRDHLGRAARCARPSPRSTRGCHGIARRPRARGHRLLRRDRGHDRDAARPRRTPATRS